MFAVTGTVTSLHLITDPETGEFKRCGYVRMSTDAEVADAIETLDGALLIDQIITVSLARPQKPKGRPVRRDNRRPAQESRTPRKRK